MGCGASKSAAKDSTVPEAQQNVAAPSHSASAPSLHKLEPIPTSSLKAVEFGLVKGLEYGPKTAPSLLVVQEWWGVNENIKELALHLHQSSGCRVFIPDLYEGKVTVEMYDALDWPASAERLVQAAEYLLNTGSAKVAAIGFCMGGALAIAASQYRKICAAVACYGLPPAELCVPGRVDSPVQIHVGTKDSYLSVAKAEEFAAAIRGAEGTVELHTYEGAGHAFLNKPDLIEQPKASSNDIALAWERIEHFLTKHVGGTGKISGSTETASDVNGTGSNANVA